MATSRLGEDQYRIAISNGEHFCAWGLDGVSRGRQIEHFAALPRAAAYVMLARLARALAVGPRMPARANH